MDLELDKEGQHVGRGLLQRPHLPLEGSKAMQAPK